MWTSASHPLSSVHLDSFLLQLFMISPASRSSFFLFSRFLLKEVHKSISVGLKTAAILSCLKNCSKSAKSEEKKKYSKVNANSVELSSYWDLLNVGPFRRLWGYLFIYLFLWMLCKMHSQKQLSLKNECLE